MSATLICRKFMAAVLPLLVLALGSCSRPQSDEYFTSVSDKAQSGRYVFELKMDDPECTYDVDIYIPTQSSRRRAAAFSEDVLVEWQAPSGMKYQETVMFSSDTEMQGDFFNRMYLYRYREGLEPVEYGKWILRLKFPSDFETKNKASGIGVRLIRNNGSR